MVKKSKESIQTECNWKTGEGYPDHGQRTDLWAWEFLRRNPAYQADWARFVAVANELKTSMGNPHENLPEDWESQEGMPYWILGQAFSEGMPLATSFDPPRNDEESENDWIRRARKEGKRAKMTPLTISLGEKWGLSQICPPQRKSLGLDARWIISPAGVFQPGRFRDNEEIRWVHYLDELSKILAPDPLPSAALQNARNLLEKMPEAWEMRRAEMAESGGFSGPRQKVTIEFDMRTSIPEQIKHANDLLMGAQRRWKESGGVMWSNSRRNKETPGYLTYLRVLDAIKDIGERDKGKLVRAIAGAMVPGYDSNQGYDAGEVHLKKVRSWIKRAKEIADSDYRRLVAVAEVPTLSEFSKHQEK